MTTRQDIVNRLEWSEQMQGDGLVDLQQDAIAEIKRLRQRVLELKRPPRGIGGQVVTVADGCPTYGHLLDAYYRIENEYADHCANLFRRIKEQDARIEELEVEHAAWLGTNKRMADRIKELEVANRPLGEEAP